MLSNEVTLKLLSFALLLTGVFLCTHLSRAQISPGKLTSFHQEQEGITKCTRCHELGQRELDAEKCLSCHTALKQRIKQGEGYHLSNEVQEKNCASCHAEHGGRDADLIYWPQDRRMFDHTLTGYPLIGDHAKQECLNCHRTAFQGDWLAQHTTTDPQRTFLGLDKNCVTCHVDEHRDQLTDLCLSCHNYDGWQPAPGFDHAAVNYSLTGRHREVACSRCHPQQMAPSPVNREAIQKKPPTGQYTQFSGLEYGDCNPCHLDPHQERFGDNCSRCHTTAGFKGTQGEQFNHDLTGFPLAGRHRQQACENCHISGDMTRSLAHEHCSDCHQDEHRGQLGERADGGACESCHSVDRFLPSTYSFEQHQLSAYPLTGNHRAVPCFRCHAPITAPDGDTYARLKIDNTDCHNCHSDIHRGQLDIWIDKAGCAFCHNSESWHRTSFDHTLARFRLEGKHREILCLECHSIETGEGGVQVWMKPLKTTCADCHTDSHRGQFAGQLQDHGRTICDNCHTPAGWRQLTFDHNSTTFPLTGGHANVACERCHQLAVTGSGEEYPLYRPTATACVTCHGKAIDRKDEVE